MNCRSIFVVIFALCSLTTAVRAQDDQLDDYSFDQSAEQATSNPYFAVGGGFAGNIFFAKYDELNKFGARSGVTQQVEGIMFMPGFELFASVPFFPGSLPNLRLGFCYNTGDKLAKSEAGDTVNQLLYGVSTSIFEIQYAIVPFKSFGIVPSLNIGWANLSMETSHAGKNIDFNSSNTAQTYSMNRFESTQGILQPAVNLEYALTPYLMAKANANYTMTFASLFGGDPEWEANNIEGSKVTNVPKEISPNGFSVQIGLYVGIFNF